MFLKEQNQLSVTVKINMNYNLIQNTTKQDYDFIDDFEKIINEYKSIGKLNWIVFRKNIKKLKLLSIILVVICFAILAIYFDKVILFIFFIIGLVSIFICQYKYMADYLREEKKFDCKNCIIAWNKIEYFRDKIFYQEINSKEFDIMKLRNFKKYVSLKVKEKKREWSSPRIVTISIIAAVGYLFANIYLKKLSMGNFLTVFKIFILLTVSILILEFMVRSMIIFFGKQDKYNQLINSIDTAIIRFQNNANHF